MFQKNAHCRPYLPHTKVLSASTLREMLSTYGSVYVKPVAGSRGRGVMRIASRDDLYQLHIENHPEKTFASFTRLFRAVSAITAGKRYIVQRDAQLARIKGRPFDVRVMLQKNEHGAYQCTGICAKVAGPHSAVTNVARSRGYVLALETALDRALGMPTDRQEELRKELVALGFAAARHMESYQSYAEIGLDVGIDKTGKLHFLEINTGPSHALFHHKETAAMYKTIQQVARNRRRAFKRRRALRTA
ncbi:hypothetical protein B2M26_09525 [Ferroacidibacillus organovorans]|uniref:ATP-grasp domain-containing protein n=2 Tax=Ferroacidibacillus organovorans TaxID=1765683 RepID=A0A1V4ET62_9BACL|nr:hypothetical protein B2M26_09525 [Ferroacidibacillus organovorans]